MSLVALLGIIFVTCLVIFTIRVLIPIWVPPTQPNPRTGLVLQTILILIVVILAVLIVLNGIGVLHGQGNFRFC